MLRRQIRERREFIYRKSEQARARKTEASKKKAREDVGLHLEDKLHQTTYEEQEAAKLQVAEGADKELIAGSRDDEYRWAGVEDPKILITTSHSPSSKLKEFSKELKLLFPNSQRINRGDYDVKQLLEACRANEVTDLIVVHERRGVPTQLVVSHLPFGPTAYFTLSNVIARHEIPDREKVSEAYPHLIFHKFETKLAKRVMDILKYLFPVPRPESKRIMTFANEQDFISYRHHVYKKVPGSKDIELSEIGPRFEMKLYKVMGGALDQLDTAKTEWTVRPYMNTSYKRRFLTKE
ncbi:U3 small nucleolar ribonucleoprotein protein IMP4-like [Watersipora subatra]|uniref:U3 small nucleolar ribonucleoprotein protein IMP4-like n=1 Tax=Watersipora subatra TaxID=2589382 RepID=UPI00355C6CE9